MSASGQQLGEIAAHAASLLIALQLTEARPLKFEALHPLLRLRIDNMRQLDQLYMASTPTPFSEWSPRPEPSFYDSHLMSSVALFNGWLCELGVSAICNPLQRFDASLEHLITQSRKAGARLNEAERTRPAIVGTSVKPYEMLRDHIFYLNTLFELNPPDLPGMDNYAMLPPRDKLRLLRFVDPDLFQLDLQKHHLSPWRHPDDAP